MNTKNSRKKANMKTLWLVVGAMLILGSALAVAVFGMSQAVPAGSPTVQTPVAESTNPAPVTTVPGINLPLQDLNGNWEADSGNGATITAVVAGETIEMTLNNEGAKALYWVGTFVSSAGVGDIVISDKVEVRKAIMSRADSKQFIIGENSMTFELSAMGKTTTVTLKRI